jgi:hypothetical protein
MFSCAGVSLLLTDEDENSTLVSMQIYLIPIKFSEYPIKTAGKQTGLNDKLNTVTDMHMNAVL